MRLIDADPLKRKAQKVATEAWKMKLTAKIETTLNQFIDWIDQAKTIEPERKTGEWIPCDERMPEEAYPVIVTWKNDDPASYYQYIFGKHFTGVAHYKNGKWFWYSSVTEDILMEYGRCDSEEFDEAIKVLAWMPLPSPYQEGGQDG